MPEGGIKIYLREGEYTTADAIKINDINATTDAPLIISAYPGEKASISGSVEIDLSKASVANDSVIPTSAKGKVYKINLKDQSVAVRKMFEIRHSVAINFYDNLFFNGKPMDIARYPDNGFMTIKSAKVNDGSSTITVSEDLSAFKNASYAMASGYWNNNFAFEKVYISDFSKNSFTMNNTVYNPVEGQRFYLSNMLEVLDKPGEWFWDYDTNTIYFYPECSIDNAKLEMSVCTDYMFNIKNSSNVIIKDIEITKGSSGGAYVVGCDGIAIENCVLKNLGKCAINIDGSVNMKISDCELYNLAGSGIRIAKSGNCESLEHGNSIIKNNKIHDYAQITRTYQPAIQLQEGAGNIVSNNEIFNGPHVGIVYTDCESLIEYNEIHNVLTETSDSGAIYSGRSYIRRGNVIRYNYLHDIKTNVSGEHFAYAIYLDDMLSGVTVVSNLMDNVDCGIMMNGGRDNIIKNNIISNATDSNLSGKKYSIWARCKGIGDANMRNAMITETINFDNSSMAWRKYPEIDEITESYGGEPVNNVITNNIIANHHNIRIKDGENVSYSFTDYSSLGINPICEFDEIALTNGSEIKFVQNSPVFAGLEGFDLIDMNKVGIR